MIFMDEFLHNNKIDKSLWKEGDNGESKNYSGNIWKRFVIVGIPAVTFVIDNSFINENHNYW